MSDRRPATLVDARELEALVARAFRRAGVPAEAAGWAAEAMMSAELDGVVDHGVALTPAYIEQLERGGIAADGHRRIIERDPPVLRLDGGNGLGPAVGWWAIDQAVDVAAECGACVCVVARGNHFGALRAYVTRAADRGMAAILTQATPPVMAPFGGRDPVLGNGPFAMAVPGQDGDHLVLDMSCAVAAKAKIADAALHGRAIPAGWALSRDGSPTTDADEAMLGAQLPWGHKGAALAIMLAAFAGIAGGLDDEPLPPGTGLHDDASRGVFIVVVDVHRLAPTGYGAALDVFKARVVGSRADEPDVPVRYPGQRAAALRRERERNGVPLDPDVLATLERLAGPR